LLDVAAGSIDILRGWKIVEHYTHSSWTVCLDPAQGPSLSLSQILYSAPTMQVLSTTSTLRMIRGYKY
jgi:hypothetical protein